MTSLPIILSYLLVQIFAVLFALRAIERARTPQGSVAWVVFLFAAPIFAVPAYLFLGSARFRGYTVIRRESKQVREGLKRFADTYPPNQTEERGLVRGFEHLAGMPLCGGNGFQLLVDGDETFDAIFAALDRAEHYVLVQFYIIHDDDLGHELQARLIACAARGVSVRLLFDAVGSKNLPQSWRDRLTQAGVEVVNIHALRGPKTRFQLNFRNHRKSVVVDGVTGFIGGLNVGDEYMGQDPVLSPWRDTHCRLTGPVVAQLQLVFAEDWHWATGEVLDDGMNWRPPADPDGMDGLIMPTGPADTMETGALYFIAAIEAAQERLWIASPYLVVENDVLGALKLAALRGVDVRILTPKAVDHRIPWLAALSYFDDLEDTGVQIWRYQDGFMHQKILLVDDRFASVGTTNFDNRSFRLNFEATAMLFDRRAAEAVAEMLEADFSRSVRLTMRLNDRPLWQRHGARFARLFAPLL
ncbi:MAG: cardiolipin synthase [Rhodobacteraceae bacterium]|nr:cardiolipin synthase [Paracoccaceae bacterium]